MPPLAYSYIRMSTEVQLKGDSLRRQLALSEEYAASKGLDLVTEGYSDIGVSAFKGDNIRTGALGLFLEKVNDGTIPKGSYLLVESLDRLTREAIDTAISLFISILRAGINIVTLIDQREYIAGSTDFTDIIYSIIVMQRAHEESLTKSKRLSAVWSKKRNLGSKQRMTSNCPAWLRPSKNGIGFDEIPERVAVVRKIFSYADAGIGSYAIARILNEANIATFHSRNGWYTSYVTKILTSRAVLGELQPHRKIRSTRVPEGPVIEGYYPPIIELELFERVQFARTTRKTTSAGRKGLAVTNLFTSTMRCGYCGSKLVYIDPGSRHGYPNLICATGYRRVGCERYPWRYSDFEQSFLAFVREIDLQGLLTERPTDDRRTVISNRLATLRAQESKLKSDFDQLLEIHLRMPGGSSLLQEKIAELEASKAKLLSEIQALEEEERSIIAREAEFHAAINNIGEMVADVSNGTYELRSKVAQRIRAIVDVIYVFPAGMLPGLRKSLAYLESITAPHGEVDPVDTAPVRAKLEADMADPKNASKAFAVRFRNTPMRIVTPVEGNPLAFHQQLIADDELRVLRG